jgi:2-polyprenyl-3-methyl-5-hydroxy-6-metoxy-1,4-benzoquinol methylase
MSQIKESAEEAHRKAVELQRKGEPVSLGPYSSYSLRTDPKHLCFVLARYKFCAKLLQEKERVLEIGCGDAVGAPIVAESVRHLYAADWDADIIKDNRQRAGFLANCTFLHFNILEGPFDKVMDAIYMIDVIEHMEPSMEARLMENMASSLSASGICIVGTPNVEASRHASPQSQIGHVNLKNHLELQKLLTDHFENTFVFSMNDEIVHTGFYPMAHYLFAVGVGKRRRS